MIIILNGMMGTEIQKIAKNISIVLNDKNKEVQNLNVLMGYNGNFEIDNKSGTSEVVHNEDDVVIETKDTETKINKIKDVFEKFSNIDNVEMQFIDSYDYDLGFKDHPDFLKYNFFHSVDEIVENAKNSENEYHVICGQIGNYTIDQIRSHFDEDEVKIYNVIMNPSISELKGISKYEGIREKDIMFDVHNALTLKELNYVTTLKIEDIDKDNIFDVNGNKVVLLDKTIVYGEYNEEDVDKLNEKYLSVDFLPFWSEGGDVEKMKSEYKKLNGQDLPSLVVNCLEKLGY